MYVCLGICVSMYPCDLESILVFKCLVERKNYICYTSITTFITRCPSLIHLGNGSFSPPFFLGCRDLYWSCIRYRLLDSGATDPTSSIHDSLLRRQISIGLMD